jgi:hypothetical protein
MQRPGEPPFLKKKYSPQYFQLYRTKTKNKIIAEIIVIDDQVHNSTHKNRNKIVADHSDDQVQNSTPNTD